MYQNDIIIILKMNEWDWDLILENILLLYITNLYKMNSGQPAIKRGGGVQLGPLREKTFLYTIKLDGGG